VSRPEIDALLEPQGFRLIEILEELETSGIAWYRRMDHAKPQPA
jgi:hypothetical protein